MRVVVTGSTGMLGSAVVRELEERGQEATGWTRETVDLRETSAVASLLRAARPELVVHCAALTDADFCEENPTLANEVNSLASARLARVSHGLGAKFVYVSTDAVYDGDRPGLRDEDEQPVPRSAYARAKLEGESRVLAADSEALVARTTMFGWTLPDAPRRKFAEEILGALTARRKIRLWSDAGFSPLHVGDLAGILLDLVELDVSGVLNVGAAYPISKADFGRTIATYFGLDASLVVPTSVDDVALSAPRPKNVGLRVKRLAKLVGRPPSVEDGVRRLHQEAFDGTAEAIRGRTAYP